MPKPLLRAVHRIDNVSRLLLMAMVIVTVTLGLCCCIVVSCRCCSVVVGLTVTLALRQGSIWHLSCQWTGWSVVCRALAKRCCRWRDPVMVMPRVLDDSDETAPCLLLGTGSVLRCGNAAQREHSCVFQQ